MNDNEISTSGFVKDSDSVVVNSNFSDFKEFDTKGYSRIISVSYYGKKHIIKSLKPDYQKGQFYEKLLKKEFEISFNLDHNNIVKVYDFRYIPNIGNCIVMEYIDGMTLKQFSETKHPKSVYRKILDELLDAMAYFHSKQIIHRDLKPENILITNNGNNVKIIDFGLSDADDYLILKQVAGTRKYAAPEQLVSGNVIDCRADIYSLGVILRNVFPDSYRKIADKCSEDDREKRFSSVNEIRNTLKNNKIKKMAFLSTCAVVLLLSVFLGISNHFLFSDKYSADEKIILSEATQYIDTQIESIMRIVDKGPVANLYDYNEGVDIWHRISTSDVKKWSEQIPSDDPFHVDFMVYWNTYLGDKIQDIATLYMEWSVESFNLIVSNLEDDEIIAPDPEYPWLFKIQTSE